MLQLTGWYPPAKRFVDLFAAVALLPLVAPVVAVACVASVVIDGPPVLFRQRRVGRWGEQFTLIKLRTMRPTGGELGTGRAYAERDRITPLGSVLRRLHVDELPQLVHVLTGDMSLVGPRPLSPAHVGEIAPGRRAAVRPGFTCFAQLELLEHGYLDKHRQVALDEEYVQRIGLRTDAAILARTVAALVTGRPGRRPLAWFDPQGAGWPPDKLRS
jgi:lipopolysaccharide/colanic/teichoic acid biosynthesis glycosyltransferase